MYLYLWSMLNAFKVILVSCRVFTMQTTAKKPKANPQVYMDVKIGSKPAGRIVILLRADVVPVTAGKLPPISIRFLHLLSCFTVTLSAKWLCCYYLYVLLKRQFGGCSLSLFPWMEHEYYTGCWDVLAFAPTTLLDCHIHSFVWLHNASQETAFSVCCREFPMFVYKWERLWLQGQLVSSNYTTICILLFCFSRASSCVYILPSWLQSLK